MTPNALLPVPGYELDDKKRWQDVTSTNKSYGTTGLIGPLIDMIAWNEAIAQREYDLLEPPKKRAPNEDNYCRGVVVDYVADYTVISHKGALSGAITIYRRYEHDKDSNKTFAIFLTTNADDIAAAEATADKIANAIAGKDLTLPQTQPPVLPKRIATQEEAKQFCGTFKCRELGSQWRVKEEDLKGNWGLVMTPLPLQDKPFPIFTFTPQIKNEQPIFRSDVGYGNPIVEATQTGFILYSDKIAPLHFDR